MNTNAKLAGKCALVTGAGTGIGREITLEFARQGADVVLHYAHSAHGAESAADEIQSIGRRASALKADFNDLDEVVTLARQAFSFLGGFDCLVNNAGITFNQPIESLLQNAGCGMYMPVRH
jgi:NAD(P)-dependent dehydrogenase (short-subunit alcohol dehydrogenase family)